MESEARRLNRWSWIFISAGTLRALVVHPLGPDVDQALVLVERKCLEFAGGQLAAVPESIK